MPRGRKIAAVVATDTRLIDAPSSFALVPEDSPLRRWPRAATRLRSPEALAAFESRVLFYDAFWHADGQRILLVGPPPLNLHWEFNRAKYMALPLDFWLGVRPHESSSVAVTELYDVPHGTREIVVRLGMGEYVLPIRHNFAHDFADRKIIAAIARDHDLDWIAEWARYHAERQGVDAVILFDNGSPRYSIEDIEQRLLAVPGLAKVAVLPWPYAYGARDDAVLLNPGYARFLPNCALTVALRRFAPLARGLLNVAIDELVETPAGTTVFDLLPRTSHGLIALEGTWMEPVPAPGAPDTGRIQRHYPFVMKDHKQRRVRELRWALEPTRMWAQSLDVHAYTRGIRGRPLFSKAYPDGVGYRRFRDGPPPEEGAVERDPSFDALFD